MADVTRSHRPTREDIGIFQIGLVVKLLILQAFDLLRISKRGNSYLRRLFVQGARAVLQQRAKQSSGLSAWLAQLTIRAHSNVAAVALANKRARMAWLYSLRMNPIGRRPWSVQPQHNWPADDAWLKPGLEIAFAIPTSTDQRLLRS